MQCLLAEKAYDAESLNQYCFEKGIQIIIPKKKNVHQERFKEKQIINFSEERYHQRSSIESGFLAIKRE